MKRFAALVQELESKTKTTAKLDALVRYFAEAPPEDAAWGLSFLSGRKIKRLLPTERLVTWTLELTGVAPWLLTESFSAVGDLAETIALLLDLPGLHAASGEARPDRPAAGTQGQLFAAPETRHAHELAALPRGGHLSRWIEKKVLPLREAKPQEQREAVLAWWTHLAAGERYVLCKLLTGELRTGVQQTLVVKALAKVSGLEPATVAHRLMGHWEPSAGFFRSLVAKESLPEDATRPYPFSLASPLEGTPEELGPRSGWLVERKWDGIRAQVVRRADSLAIWSRGEELVTERFPELLEAARALPPGTVLDGEILAWRDGAPLPFGSLQTRIGRVDPDTHVLASAPVVLVVFDVLEVGGEDARSRPLRERRATLAALLQANPASVAPRFILSPEVPGETWDDLARERERSRGLAVEGLMLKRLDSPYGTGRKKGDWWKWKIAPHTIDAVLVRAEHGHGKRASLFSDYTFAVWHEGELLPIAKAYSGLTDAEIRELDRWIRDHTPDRFGPSRRVEPTRVFEIAFEALRPSSRHRSGIAVRFPRILRERTDKKAADADTLARVKDLLRVVE